MEPSAGAFVVASSWMYTTLTSLVGVRIGTVAESYYAARSRRDPEWRLRARAAAAERYRRARDAEPEKARNVSRRYRQRLRASSVTFAELHRRVGGDPDVLRVVLTDELRRGTVELVQRRYRLNGHLPDDVRLALRDLEL